jgi:dihydroflavonol-4-reductase
VGVNVLVTGSTGFIGSQLCRALVAEGHHVRAFHRPGSPLAGLSGVDVEHAVGDITQPETLAPVMQGTEVIFHAAAFVGSARDPRKAYAATVGGTRNVLQAAREAGVRRVIHTSSVAALGVPKESITAASLKHSTASFPIIDERHTWNYRPDWWQYGHAKYLAEMEVQRAVAEGQDVVILNPAVVIGAGDLNRISGDIIMHVAQGHVRVAVPGGLNAIYIGDVVRSHLAAVTRGRTGERYILGGENLTHLRFLQIVAEVTGAKPPLFTLPLRLARALAGPISVAGNVLPLPISKDALRRVGYYFYYDTLKARVELGLADTLPVRMAVAEAYAWYKELGMVQ